LFVFRGTKALLRRTAFVGYLSQFGIPYNKTRLGRGSGTLFLSDLNPFWALNGLFLFSSSIRLTIKPLLCCYYLKPKSMRFLELLNFFFLELFLLKFHQILPD